MCDEAVLIPSRKVMFCTVTSSDFAVQFKFRLKT